MTEKLIPYNPALRPRNRGRRTGRKLKRSPQRAWVTPLQTLFLAERAALVSGRASDFTLIITIGYTGMRWDETIGLLDQLMAPHRTPGRPAQLVSATSAEKMISQIPPNQGRTAATGG